MGHLLVFFMRASLKKVYIFHLIHLEGLYISFDILRIFVFDTNVCIVFDTNVCIDLNLQMKYSIRIITTCFKKFCF